MRTEFFYGQSVDFYPILSTDCTTQVFIPSLFPWEDGAQETKIILDYTHSIKANAKSKLLILKGKKAIKEIEIPFTLGHHKKPTANLAGILECEGLSFERGEGIGCDGCEWTQKDYSSEILYCRHGSMEHIRSPYWGEQYQFTFVNKSLRPIAGGKTVKVLRFNHCMDGIWQEMELLFRRFMEKQAVINPLCNPL